jgi:HEPN domain-containing protein
MIEKHHELALQWLRKAKNDLITARQTIILSEPPTDTICFHAQQGIEKSFKAQLTNNQIYFPKTHDLILLFNLVQPLVNDISEFAPQLAEITGFGVAIRYPDEMEEPSYQTAEISIKIAIEIYNIVSKNINNSILF